MMKDAIARLEFNKAGFAFNPGTGDSFEINGTALTILRCLKRGLGRRQIVAVLSGGYGIEKEDAQRDLLDFADRIRLFGLITELAA